ncbi:MAG: DUF1376 domain-containing protein [Gammaproteobacteria bacterium]
MTDAPAPLVPAHVDLRGLDYMPLFGLHLFGSEFNAASSDSEWRAAVTLWWAAWNQVPAASLPNDDTALCRLADLGRDVKEWKRLREKALHGFVLCSDGRLYHKFLSKQALVAWDKRVQERERKRKWREKKQGQERSGDGDRTVTETGTDTGTRPSRNADVPADVNGRDVTGRIKGSSDTSLRSVSAPPVPADTIFGQGAAYLTRCGMKVDNARSFLGLLRKQARDDLLVAELVLRAEREQVSNPVEWLRKAVQAHGAGGKVGRQSPREVAARFAAGGTGEP